LLDRSPESSLVTLPARGIRLRQPLPGIAAIAVRAGLLSRRSRLLLCDPHADIFALVGATARWRDTAGVLLAMGALSGILYNVQRPFSGGLASELIGGALGGAAAMLVLSLAVAMLLGGLAITLGGHGSLRDYIYLLALTCGPLLPLSMSARAVPIVGTVIGSAGALYGFMLAVLATSTVYRLNYLRAAATVLAGLLVFTIALLLVLLIMLVITLRGIGI
jgi:hypothetical protein